MLEAAAPSSRHARQLPGSPSPSLHPSLGTTCRHRQCGHKHSGACGGPVEVHSEAAADHEHGHQDQLDNHVHDGLDPASGDWVGTDHPHAWGDEGGWERQRMAACGKGNGWLRAHSSARTVRQMQGKGPQGASHQHRQSPHSTPRVHAARPLHATAARAQQRCRIGSAVCHSAGSPCWSPPVAMKATGSVQRAR